MAASGVISLGLDYMFGHEMCLISETAGLQFVSV